jgi:hypothetical protein
MLEVGGSVSCDYRIQGETSVRNTPKVMNAINQLASDVRGQDYLTITQVDSSSLELSVNYDDITTIHTPAHFGSFLDAIAPDVIGCGVFEIETSGETWTEWIGEDQAIMERQSSMALIGIKRAVGDLLPEDFARCMEYMQERSNGGGASPAAKQ